VVGWGKCGAGLGREARGNGQAEERLRMRRALIDIAARIRILLRLFKKFLLLSIKNISLKMAEIKDFDRMFRLDGKVALVTGG
jgi:hypothetical protein